MKRYYCSSKSVKSKGVRMLVRLGDIADIFSGHPFRGAIKLETDGNGQVIQVKDVGSYQMLNWNNLVCTHVKGRAEPKWLKAGDFVFLSRGGRFFSTFLEDVKHKVVASPHFFVVRCHDEQFLPGFISWQLNQRPAQDFFSMHAVGTGQKNVPISVLKSIEIEWLPLNDQKRLMELEAEVTGEIQNLNELIENRKQQMNVLASKLLKNGN